MFNIFPGKSKKILAISITALFLFSVVFFVSPGKIQANGATGSAVVGDVTVDGTTGSVIIWRDVTITLTGNTFTGISIGDSLVGFFHGAGLPAGLTALVTAISPTVLTMQISGTPTTTLSEEMFIQIAVGRLGTPSTAMNVTANPDAKFAITGTTVSLSAIGGVTAPVTGAVPVTTVTETAQFTGTVTWAPADNPFNAGTVYTATITLTAKAGFTLTGVAADSFTVAGATATNPIDSGVVTAVFSATAAAPTTPSTTPEPEPAPREPDPWERKDVGFYEKTNTGFVTLFYSRFFRRPPDQNGLDTWVTRLVNGGITGADLVNGFIFSEENQAMISEYTNSEFIMFLYRVLFYREPGTDGFNAWLSRMNAGMTIEEVVNGFTHSTEFENLCNLFGIVPYTGYVSE